jgi:hypothetical protein
MHSVRKTSLWLALLLAATDLCVSADPESDDPLKNCVDADVTFELGPILQNFVSAEKRFG